MTKDEWADEAYDWLRSGEHDSWRCTYARPDGSYIYGCVCGLHDLLDDYEDIG